MKIDQQFGYIDELLGKGRGEKEGEGGEWEKLLVDKFSPPFEATLYSHLSSWINCIPVNQFSEKL